MREANISAETMSGDRVRSALDGAIVCQAEAVRLWLRLYREAQARGSANLYWYRAEVREKASLLRRLRRIRNRAARTHEKGRGA